MQTILGDREVLSCHPRVTAKKCLNFLFDHWIALKFLLQFFMVVFLESCMESLLGDGEVSSGQTRVTA
jgi:hypothetical protein